MVILQVMIGKYEKGEANPFIDVATKVASAFKVSLDCLAGEGQNAAFDKGLKRVKVLAACLKQKRKAFSLPLHGLLRDAKTRASYAL